MSPIEAAWGEVENNGITLRDLAKRGSVQEGDLRVLMGMEPDVTAPDQRYFRRGSAMTRCARC